MKCLCHLIDRPPDLTFNKVCRGQPQRAKRIELVNLVEHLSFDQVVSHASLIEGDARMNTKKGTDGASVKQTEG